MFGPTHLIHGREFCYNIFDHDQSLHYIAHMKELEEAIQTLLNGEDYEFSFDLNDYDRRYIAERLKSIIGPDFLLDFH